MDFVGDEIGTNLLVQLDKSDWVLVDLRNNPKAWPPGPVIYGVNCQGVTFDGYSRYAVLPVGGGTGGVKVYAWQANEAHEWTFLPLQPDAKLDGRINTRQSSIQYRDDPPSYPVEAVTFRPRREFIAPTVGVAIGGGVSSVQQEEYMAARSLVGWREFTDHLPVSQLNPDGTLKDGANG